ncbi:hypothetical protein SKAU_G00303250 [Synaphobranchus kaupii]|uniref:DDE Tnp4 domain-containing protein n=1 Tax=Synaphobranchus kaupii TaxID=118154 RepID=A0A9Q1EW38_SYNKA|nr:hypothetical protein SKAU_G00303250 [Synaphobranchus kaupii]
MLSKSKLGRDFESGKHSGVLLGDSGYPCRPWLMTPFINPANPAQETYNSALTHTRSIVERTIGQLKRRFHSLHSELRVEPPRACRIILACAVLFNRSKTFNFDEDEQADGNADRGFVDEQAQVAQQQGDGNAVRDAIVNAFFSQ